MRALGCLLLFWALAWVLVPGIAKSQIEKVVSEKLGRRVTVGSVDFKPWSLEITLGDLAIAKAVANGAQGDSPQLKITRIYIDAALESLLLL